MSKTPSFPGILDDIFSFCLQTQCVNACNNVWMTAAKCYIGVANPLLREETFLFYKTLFSQCRLWGGEGCGRRDKTCARSSWVL